MQAAAPTKCSFAESNISRLRLALLPSNDRHECISPQSTPAMERLMSVLSGRTAPLMKRRAVLAVWQSKQHRRCFRMKLFVIARNFAYADADRSSEVS